VTDVLFFVCRQPGDTQRATVRRRYLSV